MRLKPSKYNRAISYRDTWLLFNGVSSSLLLLPRSVYSNVSHILSNFNGFSADEITNSESVELLDALVKGHYLVDESLDEVEFLRKRFKSAQYEDPVTVTIATTLDCNLGCYYCYEERDKTYLSKETCDAIFDYIRDLLRGAPQKKLYVSWYGGEPMLHTDAIDYLSQRLLGLCGSLGTRYSAHMVTNGTCWPTDANECISFVQRHKINHLQFSFDGMPGNHNNRRHYVRKIPGGVSSFEALCRTVNNLVGHCALYLRLNVDRGNLQDAYELVDFFHQQRWLYPGSKVYPYVAPLLPHTFACSSVAKTALAHDSINMLQMEFRRYLSKYCDLREFVNMNYYPRTVRLLCGAVASRSVLFGPDGRIYKCVYDLGVHSLSHGSLTTSSAQQNTSSSFRILPTAGACSDHPEQGAPHDYMHYDPCSHDTCSKCEYLPICMGGCPKTQFEHNTYYTDEFKRYWDANLDTILKSYADILLAAPATPLPSLKTPLGPENLSARKELEAFGAFGMG